MIYFHWSHKPAETEAKEDWVHIITELANFLSSKKDYWNFKESEVAEWKTKLEWIAREIQI